mmetsp:Transcript_31327/g.43451  ORF Transcript_31327/g.43451 Transcript_31327/m.43451 type:complete len:231 (+) Transcript_31327:149-841(+)|eukprot:CAMPEP_0196585362 /NCGR_PEP_ID=MMETSP1081-20130531/50368_1 /TAXON_ID=36882 /ORGANISM="Pyramimonas amylifera, Strain CCMP720" /LENGTH=230 /DNA_ID=CAMNT_0041906879 /DNA_START=138 /DNA_END=830 /DNA_ORIENTATION=-
MDKIEAPHTGTTIIAVTYDGGIVIGCDTRVSIGNFISNRASDKITPLCENVFLARSGSAPDTQIVSDIVRHMVHQHSIEMETNPEVKTVANLCMQITYNNKGANHGHGLSAAMLCAGWDKYLGGQVFALPIGGSMISVPWGIDGSGSTYIWGFLDAEFKENMTREEAESFCITAISLAMARDGSSGGMVRLVTVNEQGAFRKLTTCQELDTFHEDMDVRGLQNGLSGMVV